MTHRKACCGTCGCESCECTVRDVILPEDEFFTDEEARRDWGVCCQTCDTLLLECERPAWSTFQRYFAESIDPILYPEPCQWNYTCSSPELPPIQAIYRYDREVYRVAYEGIPQLPVDRCAGELDTHCYNPPDVRQCCTDFFPTGCLCGSTDLSPFRYWRLFENRCSRFLTEAYCHKNGAPVVGPFNMRSLLLCIVHKERWWKIPVDTCNSDVRIRIPGPAVPFAGSQIVPKWWIFACSGVPVFGFDVDDAVERGVISAQEQSDLYFAISNQLQPDQGILQKMGEAGYFTTKDWRNEQAQAYDELNQRFPSAGYNTCANLDPAALNVLGPVRKRYAPFLRCRDVAPSAVPLQPPLSCEKDFPGGSAEDEQYWKDRQWVYFRAACGGWAWGCWDVTDEALLAGSGRNAVDCFAGVRGNVKPADWEVCTHPGVTNCNGQTYYYCTDLATGCPERCQEAITQGCGQFNPPTPPTSCDNLMAQGNCFGIRFVWAQYYARNDSCNTEQPVRFTCLYTSKSELKALQRPLDSWYSSEPFQCHPENPTLGWHYCWKDLIGHYPPRPIVNSIVNGTGEHNATDMCPGSHIFEYVEVTGTPTGTQICLDLDASPKFPVGNTSCPDPLTPEQIDCAGQDLKCNELDCEG